MPLSQHTCIHSPFLLVRCINIFLLVVFQWLTPRVFTAGPWLPTESRGQKERTSCSFCPCFCQTIQTSSVEKGNCIALLDSFLGIVLLKTHDMSLDTFKWTLVSTQYNSFSVVANVPLFYLSQCVNARPEAMQPTPQQWTCTPTTPGWGPITSWRTTPSWRSPQTT